MQHMASEVSSMRTAYREAKDLQRNFTLYAFNKISEAHAALQSMATHLERWVPWLACNADPLSTAARQTDFMMYYSYNQLLHIECNLMYYCGY